MFSLISDKGGKYLKLVRKFLQTNNKFEPWQHNWLVDVVKIMWKIKKNFKNKYEETFHRK